MSGFFQTFLAGGLFFVALALLRSHLRFQFLTRQVKGESIGELDINSEDAFQIRVAQYLSIVGRSPQPFAVVHLSLVNGEGVRDDLGEEAFKGLQAHLLRAFSAVCRRGDTVTWKDDQVVGMVLELERDKAEEAIDRILTEALREAFRSEGGVYLKPTMVAGASTFPENGYSLRELVRLAQESLTAALEQRGVGVVLSAVTVGEGDASGSEEEAAVPVKAVGPPAPPSRNLLDPMTGVLRADRVGSVMQRFVARYRKDELPVSILYLDIDALDRYNQHYGRKAGDLIVVEVSRIIQEVTREEDIIGRVDGEEFVVSMACPPQEATLIAQRLIAEIKRTQIPFGSSFLRVTACAGVAGFPDHGGVAKHLYDAAETALGSAKMKGRNMVAMFHRGMRAQQVEVKKIDAF